MATKFTFNGKLISVPGAYSEVKSGVNNPPLDFSFGNVVIIDKDPNNPFGGGAGIDGELFEGEKSVYEFDNLSDFRKFIGGGKYWDNALPLFRPSGPGSTGVSKILYTRAFTTVAPTLTLAWTGGGAAGGTLVFKSRHEGLCGNGVEGDEVKASQTLLITGAGAPADTIQITANGTALGIYTSVIGDTLGTIAAGVAATINANTFAGLGHGYTATASGAQVVVYAPENLGTTANGYSFVVANVGTITSTVGAATMSGGVDGATITRGVGVTMSAGTVDVNKFVLKFWRGTFSGNDADNVAYNGLAEASTVPDLIAQSPEFDNVQEVINWANTNVDFGNSFVLDSGIVTGAGTVDAADLAATTGNQLFTGGTQTYNTTKVDQILDVCKPLDFTFFYTLDSGADVQSVDNTKILASIVNDQKYEKFLVVGGGDNKDTFTSVSIAGAEYYNSDKVILVHGGCYINYQGSNTGLKEKDSSYKAAHVLGRMAGLDPQTPITFKVLGYAAEVHALSQSEKETALDKGVLVTAFDHELTAFAIVHGVNTLQMNDYVVNTDGSSHLVSLKRIAAQLNKELEINMKISLLGNQSSGPNRSTLSNAVVRNWVKEFLKRQEATPTQDNLIISSQDITAVFDQDSIKVSYAFVPNFEVNKIFVTGIIIDPSLV